MAAASVGSSAASKEETTTGSPQSDSTPQKKNLADMRIEYTFGELLEGSVPQKPMPLFKSWFQEEMDDEFAAEPGLTILATAGADGQPHARVVLMKFFDENELIFFTNYVSDKAKQIEENPKVSLNFNWMKRQRQVRIEGIATKLDETRSQRYFASRPYGSKVGAWASRQSQQVSSREELDARYADMKEKFAAASENAEVPKPPHWGGYCVVPRRVEFWQGRPSRLHDRLNYILDQGDVAADRWSISRLEP